MIPSDFGSFFFWAFCTLISFMVGVFAFIAHSIRYDFREMSKHLHGLAINVASLTSRLEAIDERLERLENMRDDDRSQ